MNNTKSNPIASYLYDFIRPFTNMNHNCPYDVRISLIESDMCLCFRFSIQHDLMIEKLPIHFVNHQVTKVLPFLKGITYTKQIGWPTT